MPQKFYFKRHTEPNVTAFISDAKDKHPTFIFSVIRSRMLPPFISDAKDKHPTLSFSIIRSRMLAPFISDAKDKHPTSIFSVIPSRMLPPFISVKLKSGHRFPIGAMPSVPGLQNNRDVAALHMSTGVNSQCACYCVKDVITMDSDKLTLDYLIIKLPKILSP